MKLTTQEKRIFKDEFLYSPQAADLKKGYGKISIFEMEKKLKESKEFSDFLLKKAQAEVKAQAEAQAEAKERAEAQRVEAQAEAFKKAGKTLATLTIFDINEIQSEIEYSYNGYYSMALKSAKNMGYTGLKCTNAQLIAQIEKLSSFETIEDLKARAAITEALTEMFTIGEA